MVMPALFTSLLALLVLLSGNGQGRRPMDFAADQGLRVNITKSIDGARTFGSFDPDMRCRSTVVGGAGSKAAVGGIHVVMIATDDIVEEESLNDNRNRKQETNKNKKSKYFANKQSLVVYCRLHGYMFHLVRPEEVLQIYGFDYNQKMRARYDAAGWVVFSKPVVILYTLHNLYDLYHCSVRHVLFVDADVFVVDLDKSLEAMISNADSSYAPSAPGGCSLIAQDSPTTINTGALIFKVAQRSNALLRSWIDNQYRLANVEDIAWQDEQGWLQLTFLQQAAAIRGAALTIDCAVPHIGAVREYARIKGIGETPLRSKCYASALAQLQLQLQSPATANSSSSSLQSSRSAGDMCLLPSLSHLDRLNLHDMPGRPRWVDGVKYVHVLKVPRGGRAVRGGEEDGRCGLAGALLYHGKSAAFTARLVRVYGSLSADAIEAQVFNYSSDIAREFMQRNRNNIYVSDIETCFREISANFASAGTFF